MSRILTKAREAVQAKDFKTSFLVWKSESEKGVAEAQNGLGYLYVNGFGVDKDAVVAVHYFELAAEQGFAKAQYNLGVIHANDYGISQNFIKAAKWFQQASEQGHPDAQHELSLLLSIGLGVGKNETEAYILAKKAAEQGLDVAQYTLSVFYEIGFGVEKNKTLASKWKLAATKQGIVNESSFLGLQYLFGDGVDQDWRKAFCLLTICAEAGDIDAQYYLGKMYRYGHWVDANYDNSLYWWQKSASQGHNGASFKLGQHQLIRNDKKDSALNSIREIFWGIIIQESVSKNNPSTELLSSSTSDVTGKSLSWLYREAALIAHKKSLSCSLYSVDDPSNIIALTAKLYQDLDDIDRKLAYESLGEVYLLGLYSEEQDFIEAEEWIRISAEEGMAHSQYLLGLMYKNGDGVSQNLEESSRWLRKASGQNHKEAIKLLCNS